jgi:hypothetical protein
MFSSKIWSFWVVFGAKIVNCTNYEGLEMHQNCNDCTATDFLDSLCLSMCKYKANLIIFVILTWPDLIWFLNFFIFFNHIRHSRSTLIITTPGRYLPILTRDGKIIKKIEFYHGSLEFNLFRSSRFSSYLIELPLK